jgi:flavorubredoxin
MREAKEVAKDVDALASWLPVPGLGVLPINSYLVRAQQPMLVDTNLGGLRDDFVRELGRRIDPSDIRWIYLTHIDADHTGNLAAVLNAAPNARIVTTFVGMAKMQLLGMAVDRCYLLNPGQELDLGDRKIKVLTPPTFDAPETTALFDTSTGTLISADSFGALLASPAETAAEIAPDALRHGMGTWANVDAPWLRNVDMSKFDRILDGIRRLAPTTVLSSHLPPANGKLLDTLLANIKAAPEMPAFVGPDQAALEAMMAAA